MAAKGTSKKPIKTLPTADDVIKERGKAKILSYISAGFNDSEILNLMYSKDNKSPFITLTKSVYKDLIAECRRDVIALARSDQEYEMGKVLLQFDSLYKNMYLEKDYRGCTTVLGQKCKLFGLGETNTVKQSGQVSVVHVYEEAGDRTDVAIPEGDSEIHPPIRTT